MSPSEAEAVGLGVVLEREERKTKITPRWFFFATRIGSRRLSLQVCWPTRAGAWQAALRWAKKLSRGELQ